MKNIHAFTETHTAHPGYVSINDEAGRITVSVRTRGGQMTSVIEMNRDQLEAMQRDVGTYLATAAAAPAPVAVGPVKAEAKPEHKAAKDKA